MVSDERFEKIIRIGAIALMRLEHPNAPSGAVGPPSSWWTESEVVIRVTLPYIEAALADL